ncbi:MAG: phosphoribosylanthranilate isomerase [Clostridiaceae bacterium]|nr:phosphoribosylanthranilate isomerase [Clostridiaceae bacterium]
MTKVKICGLRRKEDVDFVNTYLPEYVGFVFAKSKRQVSKEQAKELRSFLVPGIKAVGVFVNEPVEKAARIAVFCGLNVIQLSGDENPEYVKSLKGILSPVCTETCEIWKAVRVKDEESFRGITEYPVDAILLDTYKEGYYGGLGRTFDWNHAVAAKKYGRIILAGGLNPENVIEAVSMVRPFAVDVSSGVEVDGLKDEIRIRDFINTVRNT